MTTTSHQSTGPRTESGKSRSSQNSLKTGLFAAQDYVLESEREEYAETFSTLMTELDPKGILEEAFTSEIMSANWRLRRCHLVEATLATRENPEDSDREQKSVDRARALSHTVLRRSLSELRKLQTERFTRAELGFHNLSGVADSRQLLNNIQAYDRHHAWQGRARAKTAQADALLDQIAKADAGLGMNEDAYRTYPGECGQPGMPLVSSFCNPTLKTPQGTPRNSACPCGSGEKFKRCCGTDAPPVLNKAA